MDTHLTPLLNLPPTRPRRTAVAQPAPVAPRTATAIDLPRGTTRAQHCRAGATWLVESGRVWLTLSGDAQDHLLSAGQRWVAPHAGRVVVEGDSAEPARVRCAAG